MNNSFVVHFRLAAVIGFGEQIERIRHACNSFVGSVDRHDALHSLFVDPFSILYRIEVVETVREIGELVDTCTFSILYRIEVVETLRMMNLMVSAQPFQYPL